jgi:hypothetical protein
MYDTTAEPGGVLLMPCGNRRESVCPPCSQVYKQDARQLVRAGLTGGKGIPETVAGHPCVFATSRPRFSARCIHSGCAARPCCRVGRAGMIGNAAARAAATSPAHAATTRTVPGSAARSAPTATTTRPPSSSTPMRASCGAGSQPNLPRHLARRAGLTQQQLRAWSESATSRWPSIRSAVSCTSTRSSASTLRARTINPPAACFTADLLADAIRDAAAAVSPGPRSR